MPTVGSLAYAIVANTTNFTTGITASKSELRTLKDAFLASQSPVDRFSQAIAHLEDLATNFPSKAAGLQGSIAAMRKEMFDASEAGQKLARQKEMLGNVMSRLGLVVDPVSAAFQAFHVVSGLVADGMRLLESAIGKVSDRMEAIDKLAKSARLLGITEEALIGLSTAAKDLAGVDTEQFEKAFIKFAVSIAEAASTAKGPAHEAFVRLNLDAKQLSGMSLDKSMLKVADALAQIKNKSERINLSRDLAGKGGGELASMLAAGGDEIQRIADIAVRLSAVKLIDSKNIEEANDELDRLKMSLEGMSSLAATAFAPLAESLSTDLIVALTGGVAKGEQLARAFQIAAASVAMMVDGLEGLTTLIATGKINEGPSAFRHSRAVGEAIGKFEAERLLGKSSPAGTTGEIGLSAKALEEQAKAAETAEDKARDFKAMEIEAEMELASIVEKLDNARYKKLMERQGELADLEQKHTDKVNKLKESLESPAEKLKRDLEELNELRASGLDDATFGKGLEDLKGKARDLADRDIRPQVIAGDVRGSAAEFRSRFDQQHVTEKQLEEQKKAVVEAATANSLLTEIKAAIANQLKEAL